MWNEPAGEEVKEDLGKSLKANCKSLNFIKEMTKRCNRWQDAEIEKTCPTQTSIEKWTQNYDGSGLLHWYLCTRFYCKKSSCLTVLVDTSHLPLKLKT